MRKPVLECRFYRTAKGHEPVREWLKALPAAVRKEIGSDVGQVQWRWPIGKPKAELDLAKQRQKDTEWPR